MYVACNYTQTDQYDSEDQENFGPQRVMELEAREDAKRLDLDGVRWIGSDGYLYVDQPEDD